MPIRCRFGALVLGITTVFSPRLLAEDVVRLCADEWMPFNGASITDERPGYVIELARTIFEPRGITIDYQVMPWEDALVAVREGRMTAAIGANTAEGEGTVIPQEPIGAPPVCLMVRTDSTWNYSNLVSFRNVKLGVIKDYSYWPSLDEYIEAKAGDAVVVVEGDAPLGELMSLLTQRKVEVIAESEPVLLWHLRANNIDRAQFRVVYKHQAEPIYLAFSPTPDGRRFAPIFDAGMKALRASGDLEKMLRRYGLRDWQ